jgi:hypothetical protein
VQNGRAAPRRQRTRLPERGRRCVDRLFRVLRWGNAPSPSPSPLTSPTNSPATSPQQSPQSSPLTSPQTSPQSSPQTSPRKALEKSAPAGKPSSRNEAQPGPASPSTDDRGVKPPRTTDHIWAAPAHPVYASWTAHWTAHSTPHSRAESGATSSCSFDRVSLCSALPRSTHHNPAAPRLSERNAAQNKSHGRAERSLA